MEKAYTQLEGCLHQVEITLTRQEREPYYQKAYQKARKEIDIKGFRKGRVPIGLIKQRFGKSIEFETDQDILNSEFNKLVSEDKIKIVGQPKITDMDYDGDNLVFKLEYEVLPDFELADYKGLVIDELVHVVTDEEIEEQIDKICENNGKFEDAEQVDSEFYVVGIKLEEIDKNTKKIIEDAKPEETNLYLKDPKVPAELKRLLLNTKLKDSFEYFPDDNDKAFRVTVTDIQKLMPVEFTNELAKEISGGRFETADEYREEIGYSLQEQWDKKSRDEMENQIVNTLVDAHDFDPPISIVSQVADAMIDDFIDRFKDVESVGDFDKEKMKEDLLPAAERNVRWEIIRNKIIDKEGLELEEYDFDAFVESEAQKYNAYSDEDKTVLKKAIENNESIRSNLLAKKVLNLLLDFAITNEVPFEEHIHDHHDHDHDHHKHEHEEHALEPDEANSSDGDSEINTDSKEDK